MAGNVSVENQESLPVRTRVPRLSSNPRLGTKDFFSSKVWRASVAELLGTAILVFATDTVVISSAQTDTKTPNLIMSVLIFLTITILVLATVPVSGGHINPVISFSAALLGYISVSHAIIYILAQCIGGVLGSLALKAIVGSSIENTFSLGGCTLHVTISGPDGPITTGLDTVSALWLEMICTFVFLFSSIWIAFDERQAKALGPVVVCTIIGIEMGLMVFVSTTVTTKRGYSGVGMNPARCFGPALVKGGHLWDGQWVFWVGPSTACVAFYMYVKIIP